MSRQAKHALFAALGLGLAAVTFAAVSSCDGSNFNPPPNSSNCGRPEATADVKAFRADALALQRRIELDLDEVTIQYILIATGVDGLTESKPDLLLDEAESKAADVYKQAKAGGDYDKLVLTHSYGRLISGQRPGKFTLLRGLPPDAVLTGGPNTFRREQEEVALGCAAWRLEPGEIGAVERHEKDANSGYYVVRRLTDAEIKADNPANAEPTNEAVKTMREKAAALMARPEHGAKTVKVQHILIARYFSDLDGRHKRLGPIEAEELAAVVFAKSRTAESFSALVREYTYDQAGGDTPGSYTLVADKRDATPLQTAREGMIPAFGDAAWRLEVNEIGVIVYDRARSFYGYHIIKRLE